MRGPHEGVDQRERLLDDEVRLPRAGGLSRPRREDRQHEEGEPPQEEGGRPHPPLRQQTGAGLMKVLAEAGAEQTGDRGASRGTGTKEDAVLRGARRVILSRC